MYKEESDKGEYVSKIIDFFNFQIDIQLTATRAMIHANGRKRLGKMYLKEMGNRVNYYKKAIKALENQEDSSQKVSNSGGKVE